MVSASERIERGKTDLRYNGTSRVTIVMISSDSGGLQAVGVRVGLCCFEE